MDLLEFFNRYWTVLGGIVSVIGIFFYIQFKQAQFDKDMKTQKENYDKEFTALEVRITTNEIKVDNLKDKLQETINSMQQDIREIMTILKQNNK